MMLSRAGQEDLPRAVLLSFNLLGSQVGADSCDHKHHHNTDEMKLNNLR